MHSKVNAYIGHIYKNWSLYSYHSNIYDLLRIRWLILGEFVRENSINSAYFSDGDSFLFTSAAKCLEARSNCSAVINVESQGRDLHWVAAGEASLWTQAALEDLAAFIFALYRNHVQILRVKYMQDRSCVVDMSLLWLWQVVLY
jgi:hypothetical protein